MTALADRRHRITLMREVESIGAGGRKVKTTPILADVWAAVGEGASGATERADKQIFPRTADFTVRYSSTYGNARVISWRGAQYRIQSANRSIERAEQTLTFSAQLMEGETA